MLYLSWKKSKWGSAGKSFDVNKGGWFKSFSRGLERRRGSEETLFKKD